MLLCLLAVGAGRAGPTADEAARLAALDARPLHEFTNVDLADYLRLKAQLAPFCSPGEAIGFWARKAVGQRFRLGAMRWDLAESDCVVFTERCLAAGLAWDWESYYRLCERLRHKDGKVGVLERNHFTLLEWVPNNAWLLQDITGQLGVPVQTFTHVVRPKAFYARLQFGQDDTPAGRAKAAAQAAKVAELPERVETVETYVDRDAIAAVLDRLRPGDIALVIRRFEGPGLRPWLDCDHMSVLLEGQPVAIAIQATRRGVQVEPLPHFLRGASFVAGMKFLRLRDDAAALVSRELDRMQGLAVPSAAGVDEKVEAYRAEHK